MSFPVFPLASSQIAFARKRTPRFSTIRQVALSGRETFQPQWAWPVWDYVIDLQALDASGNDRGGVTPSSYQTMVGFWNAVMATPGGVFAYGDPEDNAVAGQATGAGDGSTTAFQLVRSLGGFSEPVLAPLCGPNVATAGQDAGNCSGSTTTGEDAGNCSGATAAGADAGYCSTLQVFEASSGPVATVLAPWSFAGGSADASGGVVAVAPAPGDGVDLTWTGSYRWLCRFPEDTLAVNEFMFQLYELKQFKFGTIRL
jgi:Conserved hypothetical protein 2217 (DUF2460)